MLSEDKVMKMSIISCVFPKRRKLFRFMRMTVRRIDILILLVASVLLICPSNAFNVDLHTVVVQRGASGSMFGFSVAQHRDRGYSWLLVGAPQAQTEQPGVERGGAVFRCSTENHDTCQQIPFDRSGSSRIVISGTQEKTDEKSHQWFGATVHSSGENGAIVACAPRYVYFSTNLRRRDPVGTCWVARGSFTNFVEYAPCRTSSWGYHRQGSCQAGFSAAITKDGRRLYIGAVGSWYWQGQIFSQNLLAKQSLFSTPEAPETDDDSYLGYSAAVGEFNGDNDMDVVIGMPRGNNLTGKVVLLNSTVHNMQNITGEQMGSYFGYSVCVSDINGDRLSDIVVGAPFYTDLSAKDGSYENGRVYVVYQNKKHAFRTKSYLDGVHSKGRFGLSLTSVGDINRDGFQDIAVGAPYGGEEARGSVFIFHGSKSGIKKTPVQVIEAKDLPQYNLKTFGFSLSGGMDLDENEYPDLLIGAYESNTALSFRSRPVINVKSTLKIDPEKINLDEKGCSLRDASLVSCAVVSFCLEYTGIGVAPDVVFVYQSKLDADNQVPRVFFLTDEDQSEQNVTVSLRKDQLYCKSVYVYIKNKVRDKLSSIAVRVSYSLFDNNLYRDVLKPILNDEIPSVLMKQVNIQKNCGKDNVCIPDLQLKVVPNMPHFLIGSNKRLKLDITITNAQEDAFETMLYLTLPLEVNYVNIDKSKLDFPISCSGAQPKWTGVNELVCDIGNPLPANKTMNFKVILAPSRMVTTMPDLTFLLTVNSTNEEFEETKLDNSQVIHLPVRVEVTVSLRGLSDPEVVSYNKSEVAPEKKVSESDAGPEVTHIYEVGNRGPSTIHEAEVHILWPTYTLLGDHLLYLMDQPEVRGKGQCMEVPNLNPMHLKKEDKKPRSSPSVSITDLLPNSEHEDYFHSMADDEDDFDLVRSRLERGAAKQENGTDLFVRELACGPTLCTHIFCTVYSLGTDDSVLITLRSRLWKETLDELGLEEVQISSKLISKVTALPYNVDPGYLPHKVYTVSTKVNPEDVVLPSQRVPWWIIIVSVSAGLLLLGLLAILLWKLGFFRRRRPEDQVEKEPLHKPQKNGYHLAKGDEYL